MGAWGRCERSTRDCDGTLVVRRRVKSLGATLSGASELTLPLAPRTQVLLDRGLDARASVGWAELARDAPDPVRPLLPSSLFLYVPFGTDTQLTLHDDFSRSRVKLLDPPSRLEELEAADAARMAVAQQLEADQIRAEAVARSADRGR